jgi:acetolactate synthase-1/2/3 large subunit
VREVLPRDFIITTDVGWNKNGVGQQFPIYTPARSSPRAASPPWASGRRPPWAPSWPAPSGWWSALVGDGGFGQNPALLATAVEENIAVIWVIMNNGAYGTIAGLQKAHYGTTVGTVFIKDGEPYSPDYAAIARAYGVEGVRKTRPEFKPALEAAIASGRPACST